MSKGDWIRPTAADPKEVRANYEKMGMLYPKRVTGDGCHHNKTTLREGLFHCLDCGWVQPETERIVVEVEGNEHRICGRCGGNRPPKLDSCAQPCPKEQDALVTQA